jgi:hypothetical protein
MAKSIITQPDILKGLVELLVKALADSEVKKSFTGLLEDSFHRILLDKDTVEKFRIFVYNLMAMELEDGKGRKSSLLELMLAKATTKKTKSSSEIESLLEKKQLIKQSTAQLQLDLVEEMTPSPQSSENPQKPASNS